MEGKLKKHRAFRSHPYGTLEAVCIRLYLCRGEVIVFHLLCQYLRQQGWRDWNVLQELTAQAHVILVFRDDAAPQYVMKIAARPDTAPFLRREAASLAAIHHVADRIHAPHLVLQSDRVPERFMFVQTGLPGRFLPDLVEPDNAS